MQANSNILSEKITHKITEFICSLGLLECTEARVAEFIRLAPAMSEANTKYLDEGALQHNELLRQYTELSDARIAEGTLQPESREYWIRKMVIKAENHRNKMRRFFADGLTSEESDAGNLEEAKSAYIAEHTKEAAIADFRFRQGYMYYKRAVLRDEELCFIDLSENQLLQDKVFPIFINTDETHFHFINPDDLLLIKHAMQLENQHKNEREYVTLGDIRFSKGCAQFGMFTCRNSNFKKIDSKDFGDMRNQRFPLLLNTDKNTFCFESYNALQSIIARIDFVHDEKVHGLRGINQYIAEIKRAEKKARKGEAPDVEKEPEPVAEPVKEKALGKSCTAIFSWKHVEFCDGKILLHNLQQEGEPEPAPFVLKDEQAKASFASLDKEFLSALPPIKVVVRDHIIVEMMSRRKVRETLGLIANYADYIEESLGGRLPKMLTIDEALADINDYNSKFHKYLAKIHLPNYKVYTCFENVVFRDGHARKEQAYIFTISENEQQVCVVYENYRQEKASIVFILEKERMKEGILAIDTYFSSDEPNKRYPVSHEELTFPDPSIIRYHHIPHSDFDEWKTYLADFRMM